MRMALSLLKTPPLTAHSYQVSKLPCIVLERGRSYIHGSLSQYYQSAGVPATVRARQTSISMVEINFLCVHKKLRQKRLAPVLIKVQALLDLDAGCSVNSNVHT